MGMTGISKSQVSRLVAEIDEKVQACDNRDRMQASVSTLEARLCDALFHVKSVSPLRLLIDSQPPVRSGSGWPVQALPRFFGGDGECGRAARAHRHRHSPTLSSANAGA